MQLIKNIINSCPPPLAFFPNEKRANIAIGVADLKEKVEEDALSPHLLAIRQINHATFISNH